MHREGSYSSLRGRPAIIYIEKVVTALIHREGSYSYIYIEKVVTALCEGDLQLINRVRCGEVMHRVCCSCNYLLKAVAAKLLYRVCSNLMSHVSLFNSNVT